MGPYNFHVAVAAVHVRSFQSSSYLQIMCCFVAYPRVYRGIDLSNATAAFLSGRPDREWLSSIVGPTGSLADLYRRACCSVPLAL